MEEAIARAEQGTAGELVVVVATRSDSYAKERALCALVLLALASGESLHFWPADSFVWFAFAQVALGLGLYALAGWAPLLRLVVPKARRSEAVDACAKRAFLEHGLMETRDRSGVLLLLSQAERRIRILADRGIHQRVEAEVWQRQVDGLGSALRSGHAAEGLVQVVESLGTLLAAHFPPRADDTNELGNEVREIR